MREVSYDLLPEHMRSGTRLYIERGVMPGGFLTAVLCNDLTKAWLMADDINRLNIGAWVRWLIQEAPIRCWGDMATVSRWVGHQGALNKERV